MAIVEDKSVYTKPAIFGDTATIGGESVDGLFGNDYVEINDVEAKHPVFLCDEDTLPDGTANGDSVSVRSTAYTIINMQPDGTGFTLLVLRKTP